MGEFKVLLAPAGVLEADGEDVWIVLRVEHRLLRGTACALAADLVGRLVRADARHDEWRREDVRCCRLKIRYS